MDRFAGKVAIVTGGARGIGAATVRRLSGEGVAVVIADLDRDHGEALAGSVAGEGGTALAVEYDIATLAGWSRLVETTIEHFGRLDVVHNNASLFIARPIHELTEEEWDRQISVCLKQVFVSVKTCVGQLQEAKGVIFNSSSIHAVMGFAQHAGYDAAKGGHLLADP